MVAERLQASLQQPFEIEGREVYASASIGIAFGNAKYRSSDDLLRDADTAMYRAKAQGRGQNQMFDPSMHASAIQRLTLETQLRRALERQEFSVHYQPIIELESRERVRLRGARALEPAGRHDDAAGGVHPGGRGDRPDRAADALGDARGLPAGGRMAADLRTAR